MLTPSGLARLSHLERLWAERQMTAICPAGICRIRRSSDCRGREFFRSLNFFDATRITRYNAQSIFGQVAQLVEQRTENPRVGSSILPLATTIQRPTVLGWAFSFAGSAHCAGFRAILRVPTVSGMGGMTRPVRPCSALSSLETCANFFAVAHAGGVLRQWLVHVPMGMVGSRVCCSTLPVQTRETSPNVSPWAGTDHDRSCCAHGSGRHALG